MIAIAPMSSTIANASRNSLRAGWTADPSRLTTATATAMSVATGMPQPDEPAPPTLKAV